MSASPGDDLHAMGAEWNAEMVLALVEGGVLNRLAAHMGPVSAAWFPDLADSPLGVQQALLALGMNTEAGEAGDIVKKAVRRSPDNPTLTDAENYELGLELADALIYLLNLASLNGIDLALALVEKMRINNARFPTSPEGDQP